MPHQPVLSPLFVRLARQPMTLGEAAWPQAFDRRQTAKAALSQALTDVLSADHSHGQALGQSPADAVASALLSAFGNGRWTLRSAPGAAEILGKF